MSKSLFHISQHSRNLPPVPARRYFWVQHLPLHTKNSRMATPAKKMVTTRRNHHCEKSILLSTKSNHARSAWIRNQLGRRGRFMFSSPAGVCASRASSSHGGLKHRQRRGGPRPRPKVKPPLAIRTCSVLTTATVRRREGSSMIRRRDTELRDVTVQVCRLLPSRSNRSNTARSDLEPDRLKSVASEA